MFVPGEGCGLVSHELDKDKKKMTVHEAAKFLHGHGIIIHSTFAFNFPDLVILDPRWLFETLTSFFETSRDHTKLGVLSNAAVLEYLDAFPEEFRHMIVLILEKLELIYLLPDTVSDIASMMKRGSMNTKYLFIVSYICSLRLSDGSCFLSPSMSASRGLRKQSRKRSYIKNAFLLTNLLPRVLPMQFLCSLLVD